MSKIPDLIRRYIREEQRGLYTFRFALVEAIDEQTRRAEVSIKTDENLIIDDVPVASLSAGDGHGHLVPVTPGETEGILLCMKDPLDDVLTDRGRRERITHRQHSLVDAVFFPQVFYDADTVPEHEPGEYLYAHESGSVIRVKPDATVGFEHPDGSEMGIDENGEVHLTHSSGTEVRIATDGSVQIGDPASVEPLAPFAHTHDFSGTDSDGDSYSGTTDEPNGQPTATELE